MPEDAMPEEQPAESAWSSVGKRIDVPLDRRGFLQMVGFTGAASGLGLPVL